MDFGDKSALYEKESLDAIHLRSGPTTSMISSFLVKVKNIRQWANRPFVADTTNYKEDLTI